MADYIKYEIEVEDEEKAEILTAFLSELPFESFEYEDKVLKAYIPTPLSCEDVASIADILHHTAYRSEEIKAQNWNAEWESHFEEVEIDNKVIIRAPFHTPRPEFGNLDIVIRPKMSFGTGHHATTRLMVKMLLGMDLSGKRILDMGSGTGVLAIVSAKLGADRVLAVEIDDMAEESVRENIEINGVSSIVRSVCGDARAIRGEAFDTILANINRNILLHDMGDYRATLTEGGRLIISGFLAEDVDILTSHAAQLGFVKGRHISHEGWQAVEFIIV